MMIATGGLVQMLVIPLLVVLAPALQKSDTVAVRVRVTDAASNNPIAAVSVRLLDVQNGVLASGITDSEGLFVRQIQARPTIQVEYEKVAHVRRPERLSVSALTSPVSVNGRLLRTGQRAEYYRGAANEADRQASSATDAVERENAYKEAWERAAVLDNEDRVIFVTSLSAAGKSVLASNPSFAATHAAAGQIAKDRQKLIDDAAKRLVYEVVLTESSGSFKFSQPTLPDEQKVQLDALVQQLKANPARVFIEIEGHTDNAGESNANYRLGLERAESVKRYLYEQHQIPLDRMNVISYGEDKPVAPNNTRDGRAQNRRVVVKVLS